MDLTYPLPVAILIPLILFGFIAIGIGMMITGSPTALDSLLYKRKNRLKRFALQNNFALQKQIDTVQWNKNITETRFTQQLFGNWKNLHGTITPITYRGTGHYKDYETELLWFYITAKTDDAKNPPQTFGPYVGIHFNLHKSHMEVDVIYKESNLIRNMYERIGGSETIKQRTWETESPDFNKQYVILSDHHVTNLTVLTPDVMIMILENKAKINIEIVNHHLLIYTASKIKHEQELESMIHIGYRIAENLE